MVHKRAVVSKVQHSYLEIIMRKKYKELTIKEIGVLELLARGLLYKEIAAQKSISIDTVKKHCKSIYKKLNARNRMEAVLVKHKQIWR